MQLRLRRPLPLSALLVGVDGGASEVKAHEVLIEYDERGARLALGPRSAHAVYPRIAGFETPAARGVSDATAFIANSAQETEQGWAWVEATAACIVRVAREREATHVLLGVAMPGVKTRDRRGIEFALNGPRIPKFAAQLERALDGEGIELLAPLQALVSDGLCCGLGEEHATNGSFRDVENAYYVGGGTGVAEALKLRGQLVELDTFGQHLQRAWQLREPFESLTYDAALSAAGINRQYARATGDHELDDGARPEEHVGRDERARALFELTGKRLACLIKSRVVALRAVEWEGVESDAPRIERVVVGQRLGALLADRRTTPWFLRAFREQFARELREELTSDDSLAVRCSSLRAAPAIGAAACALIAWDRPHG